MKTGRRNVCSPLPIIVSVILLAGDLGAFAVDRTDAVFLNQLIRRGLFDVANRFCEDRRERSVSVDDAAEWMRELADIAGQRSWLQDSGSRNELLNQQIDQLETIFNSPTPLSPAARIRSRYAQIELMVTGLQIRRLLSEAGHLCRRKAPVHRRSQPNVTNVPSGISESDGTVELLEQLLSEIDRDRKELGPIAAEVRDEGRLLKARLHLVRAGLVQNAPARADSERAAASDAANAVVRATRNRETKRRAYQLITACLADGDSVAELESHARRLDTLFPNARDKSHKLLLVRSRLRHQDADGALRYLKDYEPTRSLDLQRIAWLELEAALVRFETALELRDEALIASADKMFQDVSTTAELRTRGAYRDAVDRVQARYELSKSVGIEVADLIERVAAFRQANDDTKALQLIDTARDRLPSDAWRPRAALDLTAGEILISQSDFPRARRRLSSAVSGFGRANDKTREAAADLLRIYAISQSLTDQSNAAERQIYAASLKDHLTEFPQARSAFIAREWLITLLQNSDPLECFQLLQEQMAAQPDVQQKIDTAERIGIILPPVTTSPAASSAHAEYRQLLTSFLQQPGVNTSGAELLRFFEIEYAARNSAEDHIPDWESIASELDALGDLLPSRIQQSQAPVNLQSRYFGLLAVVTARTTTDPQTRLRLRKKLLELRLPSAELIDHIAIHLNPRSMQSGDQWLAELLDTILRRTLSSTNSPSEMIDLLDLAESNARITGRPELPQEILVALTRQQLEPAQTSAIAEILGRGSNDVFDGQAPVAFWQQVAESNVEGSDLWLEASLQLAELAVRAGRIDSARRRIGVVTTLYPDWGSEQRRLRANTLMKETAVATDPPAEK